MKDVSILIPVYCETSKHLDWLGECLESACQQDCEIILYDDASPVNISNVVLRFPIPRYIKGSQNRGAAYARNICAKYASRSLIIPLDCDDRFKPNAVSRMLEFWEGIPVYCDIQKFGSENVDHYPLLDFNCEVLRKYVGFSSVNVLHSKKQWRSVGGWDPNIEFYEDGLYNAELFAKFCARRVPEPLVEYRQHESQRTKKYRKLASIFARSILEKIRRLDMPCSSCGGKKNGGVASQTYQSNMTRTMSSMAIASKETQMAELPGELNGRVLTEYVGGAGRGKHYINGPVTKYPYKVMHGQLVYVDPADAREETDDPQRSPFVRVRKDEPKPVRKPVEEKVVEVAGGERTPVETLVERTPVPVGSDEIEYSTSDGKTWTEEYPEDDEDEDFVDVEELDPADFSIPQMREFEPDAEEAEILLEKEKQGLNRKGMVRFLESRMEEA